MGRGQKAGLSGAGQEYERWVEQRRVRGEDGELSE